MFHRILRDIQYTMAGMVVSILGCGWLGKPLGTKLAESGYVVHGSTTREENVAAIRDAGIDPFVLHTDKLTQADARFFDADVLLISVPHRARAGKAEEYLLQIKAVIEAAHSGNVRNILQISTTSVYPDLNREVTEEDADHQNPIVQAENLIRESGIPATVLRLAGLFGPGRHPGKFLAGKTDLKGGDAPVNLIHLDDCIEIIRLIIARNIWNEVLNACADDHPTRKEFYTKAALELELPVPAFARNSAADYKIVSNTRLKRALNYTFRHRLI